MSDASRDERALADAIARHDAERGRLRAIADVRDGVLQAYRTATARAVRTTEFGEYCSLQATWNQQVLDRSSRYVMDDSIGRNRMLSIGSFLGLVEIAYAAVFKEVVCVDHADFIADFHPSNITFHQADLDTGDWRMPEGRFDICFMVEILEHFMWSPVALLKWIRANCSMLVITTPDDAEWPELPARPYMRHQHFSAIPGASPGVSGNPEPMSHCKQYSQAEFLELLQFCGFRVVEFSRVGDGSHQMLAICTPR